MLRYAAVIVLLLIQFGVLGLWAGTIACDISWHIFGRRKWSKYCIVCHVKWLNWWHWHGRRERVNNGR